MADQVQPTQQVAEQPTQQVQNQEKSKMAESTKFKVIAKGGVNVRKAPDKKAEIVKVLKLNEEVDVQDDKAKWIKVTDGYILNETYILKKV